MGGVVGHIDHLYDDLCLTFGELRRIVKDVASGAIVCTEKTDGQQLSFCYDRSRDFFRVARSKTDIKNGGLDRNDVQEKFKGRGIVQAGFLHGYDVLRSYCQATRFDTGGLWLSSEILWKDNPNVVAYGLNSLIIHELGSHRLCRGVVEKASSEDLFSTFVPLDVSIAGCSWTVRRPPIVTFQDTQDAVTDFEHSLSNLASKFHLTDDTTLRDFLRTRLTTDVDGMGWTPSVSQQVIDVCMGSDCALPPSVLTRNLPLTTMCNINAYVRNSPIKICEILRPISEPIRVLGDALLRTVVNKLSISPEITLDRTLSEFHAALSRLQQDSKDDPKAAVLWQKHGTVAKQVRRLNPLEGIIFQHSSKTYKMTGSFSIVSQILGREKYSK